MFHIAKLNGGITLFTVSEFTETMRKLVIGSWPNSTYNDGGFAKTFATLFAKQQRR